MTIRFVWYPIGVTKAKDAANAIAITNGRGLRPAADATEIEIGRRIAATALLVINSVAAALARFVGLHPHTTSGAV